MRQLVQTVKKPLKKLINQLRVIYIKRYAPVKKALTITTKTQYKS